MSKIVRVFLDTNMGNGHRGCLKIAKKSKIDLRKLAPGEYAVFINKRRTIVKMFATNEVLAHYKGPKIDLAAVQHLPNYFSHGQIDVDAALERVWRKQPVKHQVISGMSL